MTDKFIKLTNWLAKACGIFAAGCLFLSIVIITELVFERYLFKNAITWAITKTPKSWTMNKNFLSRSSTTDIDQIPTIVK